MSCSLNQNKVAIAVRIRYFAHGWNFARDTLMLTGSQWSVNALKTLLGVPAAALHDAHVCQIY